MNVIKGENATRVYGDKGKNGVILINTKLHDKINFVYESEPETNEQNVEFIMDSDKDENVSISYHIEENDDEPNVKVFSKHLPQDSKTMLLKKSATDDYLKSMKTFFTDDGIDFKYSKIKRNKNGQITSIKIVLSDDKGNKSSDTWKDNENGIPRILVGKIGESLIASSSY